MSDRMRQPDQQKLVLVVEDNEDVRKVVVIYLRSNGFGVVEAGDGLAGLQMAEDHAPDVILFDVLLPRLDGIEALKRLRKTDWGARIPVIMMSAILQTKDVKAETSRLGVSSFLQKPFQVRTMLEEIRKAIGPTVPSAGAAAVKAPPGKPATDGGLETRIERKVNVTVAIPHLGTLEEYPLPQIVHGLFAASRTGRMRIVVGTTEKRIYFQNGFPVFAESSIPEETLGAHLVIRGIITEQQHAEVRSEMNATGRHFGEVMLKRNLIGPHELFTELEAHLTQKVISTFAWKLGKFKFDDNDTWKDDVIIARMKPGRIILDGVQRHWTRNEILAALPFDQKGAIVLMEDAPYSDEQLGLSGREARIVQTVRRRPGLGEFNDGGTGYDFALSVLYSLYVMQLVGYEKTPSVSPPLQESTAPAAIAEGSSTVKNEESAKELMAEYLKYRAADFFKLLGLSREATNEEITQAFKERQRRYHPDTLIGIDTGLVHEKIEELFIRVHTAYKTLIDPTSRRRYERELDGGAGRTMLSSRSKTGKFATLESKEEDQILFEDAFSMLRNGDFEQALPLFEAAERLVKKPKYSAYRTWTAYLVSPGKLSSGTERELLALLKQNGDEPLMAHLLGNYYLREKQAKKAVAYFEKALEIDPQHIDSARQLRILRMRLKTETSGLFDLFKKK
jgi:CheY-like chemotaxis protein/curved DNA-binding protein CbpA